MYGEFRTEPPWLQTCLKNITAGAPFPGRKEDFDSEAAWQYWKTLETAHLSQLMVILVQFNPELAKSTPSDNLPTRPGARPGSMYDRAQRNGSVSSRKSILSLAKDMSDLDLAGIGEDDVDVDGDDEVQVGHNFTYIPPNPKKYYRRLLEYCLEADLRAMRDPNVNDDDQVSLGILSPGHIELINECALRWRIPQPYRVACFLELIKELYERNEVPLDCIPEALSNVQKVMHEIEFDKWPIADVSLFPSSSPLVLWCANVYMTVGISSWCLRRPLQHLPRRALPLHGLHPEPQEIRRRRTAHDPRPSSRDRLARTVRRGHSGAAGRYQGAREGRHSRVVREEDGWIAGDAGGE